MIILDFLHQHFVCLSRKGEQRSLIKGLQWHSIIWKKRFNKWTYRKMASSYNTCLFKHQFKIDRPALPPEVLSNQLLCIALLLFLRPHCCWGINSRWTEQITKFNIHTTKEGKQSSGSYSQSNSKIWLHVYPSSAISESPYQTQNLFQSINQINRRLQLTKQH